MTEHRADGSSMADVSGKAVTHRRALACGSIYLGEEAFLQVVENRLEKGDALSLAEFAGIMAAKQTPALIPLCHPISLNRVAVHPVARPATSAVEIFCYAEIAERTGVEMEALCGLSVALLTVWDLAKPVNPALRISGTRLLFKSGGKNGTWQHPDGLPAEARQLLERYSERK
ncbi:MAG: cyclic pyranopterin monophosphate synthase MoaC [Xanthomonadales bacterium]|nr:cyclic pyranopterin monophosphate synthase MoaC [Gammaproteobacteria bacterium]NNE04439.1 cyclic pyranopterin monophosphate synthase MoaC [Xanthomonadales bacterium]NNL94072.1 cyclic pyranopterin monophosphate synthase MoaC [Xanthomonadales bacterium]